MNSFLLVGLVILFLLFVYLISIVHSEIYLPIKTNIPTNLPTYQCVSNLTSQSSNFVSDKNVHTEHNLYVHRPNNYKLLNATVDPIEI